MKTKELNFIINNSEIAAGTRGSSLGPEAIITAARNEKSTLFGKFPIIRIPNRNDLLDKKTPHQFAKRIDGVIEIYESLNQTISSALKKIYSL